MATRYLQAQHKDKRGLHSGDGRAIWNGRVKAGRRDVRRLRRGTGATRLSPGAQIAGVPVKTGDDSYGYSCGTADLDEMLGTALMSEIFHRNGLPTERTLAVIDFGDGTAIGVRAAPNLLRPAHIFRYLKQGRHAEMKAALDYFIDRQVANGEWKLPASLHPRERYRRVLTYIARVLRPARGHLRRGIHLQLARVGRRQHAGQRRDPRLRLDPPVRRQARQVSLRRRRSVLVDADRAEVLGARAGEGLRAGDALRPDRAKAEPAALQGHPLPQAVRRVVRDASANGGRSGGWGSRPSRSRPSASAAAARSAIFGAALSFFEEIKVARGTQKSPMASRIRRSFSSATSCASCRRSMSSECELKFGELMDAERFCQTMAASYASRRDLRMTPDAHRPREELPEVLPASHRRRRPYDDVLRRRPRAVGGDQLRAPHHRQRDHQRRRADARAEGRRAAMAACSRRWTALSNRRS